MTEYNSQYKDTHIVFENQIEYTASYKNNIFSRLKGNSIDYIYSEDLNIGDIIFFRDGYKKIISIDFS